MRPGTADGRWKWLALDDKLPVSQRLVALNNIQHPTLTYLNKLLRPNTPAKLLFKATELYELMLAKKHLLTESLKEGNDEIE